MITALMVPMITVISIVSTSLPVFAQGSYENVARLGENAYNNDVNPPPPWVDYGPDKTEKRPVIMACLRFGSGGVVAAGLAHTLRDGRWNDTSIPENYRHLDNLLHYIFQWMRPGAKKVAWYNNTNPPYEVYNTTTLCGQMVTALTAKGYTVTGVTTAPITLSWLINYDILVIPQLEMGKGTPGGDPSLLPDSDVENIKAFVQGGGGLLILDGADTFTYNYCKVQNKILKNAFNFGIYFQSDELRDPTYCFGAEWEIYADVDNTTAIGKMYQDNENTTRVGVYMPCSLAVKGDYELGLSVSPGVPVFQEGFPGGKLTYKVEVTSLGWKTDNYDLTVENTWPAVLENILLENVGVENSKSTTLTVTIPSNAKFGDETVVTVTATSRGDSGKSKKENCRAVVAMRIGPPNADAYVSDCEPTKYFGGSIWMWVTSSNTTYQVASDIYKNSRAWMRFDLRGIPSTIPPGNWTKNNLQARLYAFCWGVHGAWGENVQCWSSDNDNWIELGGICGENQPALNVNKLDTTRIPNDNGWVSWDITDFIRSELNKGENFASFYLRAENENLAYPDNFGVEFYPKESNENIHLPYIAIGYGVDAEIMSSSYIPWSPAPKYGEALPGGTISYSVKVMNRGSFADNYTLTKEDTKTWPITLPGSILNVQPNEVRRVDLDVQIPISANICAENDNIRVTVKSDHYPENAKDSDNCIAHPSENRILPAKEDSTTRGELVVPLENSVWGNRALIWVGRENVFSARQIHPVAPERGWLKFDLRGIPSLENVARATLNLYCANVENGGAFVQVCSVSDDSWSEDNIGWLNKPPIGNVLDNRDVSVGNRWYSWDVTDFVRSQFQGDNVASFCLVDLGENLDPQNFVGHFATFVSKENVMENEWPYLEVLNNARLPTRDVRVYISPVFQGGLSGWTDNYRVTVVNKGKNPENFKLENKNDLGWTGLSLESALLTNIPAGGSGQTTLHVPIPSGPAVLDNITVIAKTLDNTVTDNTRCFAYRGSASVSRAGSDNIYIAKMAFNFLIRENAIHRIIVEWDKAKASRENTLIWSGITPRQKTYPTTIIEKPSHNYYFTAELVWVDNEGKETSLAKLTVNQDHLSDRISYLIVTWLTGSPAQQDAWSEEISTIIIHWLEY